MEEEQLSVEAFIASRLSESPTGQVRLMESILERTNMLEALRRVQRNAGAPGVDGMTTGQLKGYIKRHWDEIKGSLLDGTYQPLPVRRKEIDKPDGGVRLLGIPTVLDRMVQQAIAQVLNHIWDHTFSENSFGLTQSHTPSGFAQHSVLPISASLRPSRTQSAPGDPAMPGILGGWLPLRRGHRPFEVVRLASRPGLSLRSELRPREPRPAYEPAGHQNQRQAGA